MLLAISKVGILISLCATFILARDARMHNCKKTLRNIAFERCSGFRSKRSALRDELNPAEDSASEIEASHARKQRIMSIRKFVLLSRVPMLDIQYPSVTSFARRSSTPIVPPTSDSDYYQTSRRFEYLPQENGSDLGFEMDNEEMIELFNEIYGRLPRSLSKSREDAERDFFMAAYECCKNEELCHSKKGPIIPCV